MQNNSSIAVKTTRATKPKPRAASKDVQPKKKVVKKALRKIGASIENEYLRTLVDPENCHGVRYPDNLPKGTSVFRGLINRNAFYFPDNTIEPAGTCFHVLSPTLINPLLEYRAESVTTPALGLTDPVTKTGILAASVTTVDDSTGLFPLTEDIATIPTGSDEMWLLPGAKLNLRALWGWRDQDFTVPPFRGFDPAGAVFYGIPVGFNTAAFAAGGGNIHVRVNFSEPAQAATNFNLEIVSTAGTQTVPFSASAAGSTSAVCDVGASVIAGLLNAGGYAPLPGIGFRISNPQAWPQLITSYAIYLSPDNNTTVPVARTQPRFSGISLPDESTYAQTVDQYRVVSMSEWLEYDGSDLNNGGQVSSIMYRGGQSAGENGLYSYTPISQAPESYAGPLKHGTYTVWAPNSDNDMLMRNLSPHQRWQYPFIANAAVIATPSQVNAVRLRIAINYEIVSTSQFYDFEKPIPHPEWILEASLALREHPCTMANGKHWDWIKGVVKDAVQFGTDAVKWGVANKDWLVPAGLAVASLV